MVIKTGEKKAYFQALQQADTGNLEAFIVYIGEQLAYSLDLMLRGAKGADIEEDDDLDKQIALLKASLKNDADEEVRLKRSERVVQETYVKSIEPLFKAFEAKLSKFDELFAERALTLGMNGRHSAAPLGNSSELFLEQFFSVDPAIRSVAIDYRWLGFKKLGTKTFNASVELTVQFEEFVYNVTSERSSLPTVSKLYHQVLSPEEIKGVVDQLARHVLSLIQQRVKQ